MYLLVFSFHQKPFRQSCTFKRYYMQPKAKVLNMPVITVWYDNLINLYLFYKFF